MLLLSDITKQISGLNYLVEQTETFSRIGARMLYSLPFMTKEKEIQEVLSETEQMIKIIENDANENILLLLQNNLMLVHDIENTVKNIPNNKVKDDIELFEIKNFAILAEIIKIQIKKLQVDCIYIPDLKEVITILDPENKNIPSFYIYDAYSEELRTLRKQYKTAKNQNKEELAEQILFESIAVEDDIRRKLSEHIRPFAENIAKALNGIAKLDILLAKAYLAIKFQLSKPHICFTHTHLQQLFNPQIQAFLDEKNKKFQAIDIYFKDEVTLITGANMGGKSVLLKTIAITQYLMQFGFYVPCKKAKIQPKELILLTIGDGQDEMQGLSSFGAEMLILNQIISYANEGKKIIALIDEPARTTNPTEGKALVKALCELLNEKNIMSLITTHYSGINSECKKLRVRGFDDKKISGKLDICQIEDYMDYTLVEDSEQQIPQEALRIAEMLGTSKELIDRAKKYVNQ